MQRRLIDIFWTWFTLNQNARSGDLDNLFASYAKEIGSKARPQRSETFYFSFVFLLILLTCFFVGFGRIS